MPVVSPRCTGQPQYAAPIGWGNPVTQGLAYFVNAALASPSGYLPDSAAAGYSYNNTSPSLSVNVGGRSFNYNATGQYVGSSAIPAIGTGDFSIVAAFICRSNNTTQAMLAVGSGVAGAISFAIRNGPVLGLNVFNGTLSTVTSPSIVIGKLSVYAVTRRSGLLSFYVDGVLQGTATNTGSVVSAPVYLIGGGQSETNGAGLWTRCLSANEIASLSANLWQVYQAPPRRLWVPAPAGGDASVSLTGAAATSAAGAVTASGTAATTLAGAADSSTAGTVTASGSSNATLTGAADTSTAGTVAAQGSSTATLNGASAADAAGSVAATGSASATLGGAAETATAGTVTATASGSGTVTLTGAADTTAAGTMTASGQATVALSGAASTTAAGHETASGSAQVTPTGVAATAAAGAVTAISSTNPPVTDGSVNVSSFCPYGVEVADLAPFSVIASFSNPYSVALEVAP